MGAQYRFAMIDDSESPLTSALLAYCETQPTPCLDDDEDVMAALRRDFDALIYAPSAVLPAEAVVEFIQIPA